MLGLAAGDAARSASGSASCRSSTACTATSRCEENLRFFARLYVLPRAVYRERRGAAPRHHAARARSSTGAPTRSRAACTRSSRSRARSCTSPRCCSSTSRRTASTRSSRRELWALLHEFVHGGHDRARLDAVHGRGGALPPGRARAPRARSSSRASRRALIAGFEDEVYEVHGRRRATRWTRRSRRSGRFAPPPRPARGSASWWRAAVRTRSRAALGPARRRARARAAVVRGPVPRPHRGARMTSPFDLAAAARPPRSRERTIRPHHRRARAHAALRRVHRGGPGHVRGRAGRDLRLPRRERRRKVHHDPDAHRPPRAHLGRGDGRGTRRRRASPRR